MPRSSIVMLTAFALLIGPIGSLADAAPPKPRKITLNVAAKTLTAGQKFTARVKAVKPPKASKKVRWSSSKRNVATVTGKGVVKAVGAGTATITAKSVVRPKVKAKIKVTVKKAGGKKPPVIVDPKLLGTWNLIITGAISSVTFNANGTWNDVLLFKAPLSPLQAYSKGEYSAKNGKLHYSDIVFRSRTNDDEPWSAWKPAAKPNRVENYEVGTDEYGDYLMTEPYPDPVTPESARYRRSE